MEKQLAEQMDQQVAARIRARRMDQGITLQGLARQIGVAFQQAHKYERGLSRISAGRLYHDLTQVLRLCVSGKFDPKTAGVDLLRVMARAGDAPDFSSLQARLKETQAEVRRVFKAVVEGGT